MKFGTPLLNTYICRWTKYWDGKSKHHHQYPRLSKNYTWLSLRGSQKKTPPPLPRVQLYQKWNRTNQQHTIELQQTPPLKPSTVPTASEVINNHTGTKLFLHALRAVQNKIIWETSTSNGFSAFHRVGWRPSPVRKKPTEQINFSSFQKITPQKERNIYMLTSFVT